MSNHPERPADRGFTLVEILIVVVILGVLATITVFAVRGITDRGEEVSCGADYETVRSAAEYYLVSNSVAAIPATGAGSNPDRYEQTLVDAELLRSTSRSHDLAADGTVTAVDDPCP